MKPPNSRNGFTLIEVLMAMAVFSVGFLGLASMSTTAVKGNANAIKVTIATTLAQDKLDEIRNIPYSIVNGSIESSVPNYPWARRETIVTPDNPEVNVKKVEVKVSVKDANGNHKTLAAFTVLKSQ